MESTTIPNTFDYVVVGGGTAGCVIAARLTENPLVTVCIIEAGGDATSDIGTMVPGFAIKNLGDPKLDWNFRSTPQTNLNHRELLLNRGKALGGSSMQGKLHVTSAEPLMELTIESFGSLGWNWNSLLPYFKKSETFTVLEDDEIRFGVKFDPQYHGSEGPLQRSLPKWTSTLDKPFRQALESFGIKYSHENNGGDNSGIWTASLTVHPTEAVRSSSATAYHLPNKSRSNLHTIVDAHATRVLFEKDKKDGKLIASGVEYSKNGSLHSIQASKEVILCAGSFQTPQLLELSGIGNKDALESHGINVLHELSGVGENLPEVDESIETLEILSDPERAAQEWKLFQESKQGILTATPISMFAFLPVKDFVQSNLVLEASEAFKINDPIKAKALSVQKAWVKDSQIPHLEISPCAFHLPVQGKAPEPGKRYFSLFVAILHPFSRGTVHIDSANPLKPPSINLNVFDNDVDLNMMVEAIRFGRKVAQQAPFASIIRKEVLPGPEVTSDVEIKEWIKSTVQTVFHPIGTASLLPFEDGGVVDPNLRVYGTENLRVVDASILPIQISAHPQGTIYAIAEKGADIIKNT
ncbi:GMC oxidoreductase [Amanita thiersii Skay4041]|uniref:GMC oxidoreductase n=1 Tax=Amanita thiersii Skay4041 TaxID=703135 RepID=A0A2A9NGP3_9AGAR|nr:GMC oxidoreductase [Amanita thiersii Skay4041]